MTKSRTLELTVLSAEELRRSGKPLTKNEVSVVVRADSLASHTTSFKRSDESSDSSCFVSWNEKFLVEVGPHARCIAFEVRCKTSRDSVRDVAVARVAVTDILGTLVPDHCLQFLSYRLRDSDGLRNGIVHFSVRAVAAEEEEVLGGGGCGLREHVGSSDNGGDQVVTGIPVYWKNGY